MKIFLINTEWTNSREILFHFPTFLLSLFQSGLNSGQRVCREIYYKRTSFPTSVHKQFDLLIPLTVRFYQSRICLIKGSNKGFSIITIELQQIEVYYRTSNYRTPNELSYQDNQVHYLNSWTTSLKVQQSELVQQLRSLYPCLGSTSTIPSLVSFKLILRVPGNTSRSYNVSSHSLLSCVQFLPTHL